MFALCDLMIINVPGVRLCALRRITHPSTAVTNGDDRASPAGANHDDRAEPRRQGGTAPTETSPALWPGAGAATTATPGTRAIACAAEAAGWCGHEGQHAGAGLRTGGALDEGLGAGRTVRGHACVQRVRACGRLPCTSGGWHARFR